MQERFENSCTPFFPPWTGVLVEYANREFEKNPLRFIGIYRLKKKLFHSLKRGYKLLCKEKYIKIEKIKNFVLYVRVTIGHT